MIVDLDSDGRKEIVLAAGEQVLALKGSDGARLWEHTLNTNGMSMTVADIIAGGWLEIFINDYGDPHKAHLLDSQDGSGILSGLTKTVVTDPTRLARVLLGNLPERVMDWRMYNHAASRRTLQIQDRVKPAVQTR